jgi:inositol transport system substrate-binding protein
MKKVLVLAFVGVMAVWVAAAGVSAAWAAEKPIVVGYGALSLNNAFIKALSEALEAKGKELGAEVLVSDAQDNIERQVGQIEDFIAKKVDVIIFNPTDVEAMNPSVEACKKAGIPLILVNTTTSNTDYTCYVGSSNEESGIIQGRFLAEKFKGRDDVKVVVLHGPFGHSAEIGRYEGLKQTFLNQPGVKVLSEQTGNWKREEGLRIMEDWLQAYPKIDCLASQNDEMALGALEAIKAAGRLDEILVVGIDALPEACAAVGRGEMAATVFQDAAGQGIGAIEMAVKAAKGESIPKEHMIPFKLVTKENVDEYDK